MINILIIILSYFIGSISSSILICKIWNFPDPRYNGSKNPGATNILRIAGYKFAIIAILFDSLKGAIPIWLSSYTKIPLTYLEISGIAACIGHMYPIFFRYQGGKGVSTAFGILSAINLNFLMIMSSSWIITVFLFRYASLGSIITTIITCFYAWYTGSQHCLLITTLSILILIKHLPNIKRLYQKKENRIFNR